MSAPDDVEIYLARLADKLGANAPVVGFIPYGCSLCLADNPQLPADLALACLARRRYPAVAGPLRVRRGYRCSIPLCNGRGLAQPEPATFRSNMNEPRKCEPAPPLTDPLLLSINRGVICDKRLSIPAVAGTQSEEL
jgi:hypothetical protein